MLVKLYIFPVTCVEDQNIRPVSILFSIYDKNDKQIFDTKICYLNYFINNQNFTVTYLQETFHSILLGSTNIPIEKANLFTSKFENYILNIVKENLYKNYIGPWFIELIIL